MKVGDMVKVKPSQSLRGEDGTGIITASKGQSAFSDHAEVFWVLVNGRLSTYGSNQLIKEIQ